MKVSLMPLWVPRDQATPHPMSIDKLIVAASLASSLAEARRLIQQGSIYLNNVKIEPPQEGLLPLLIIKGYPELYPWFRCEDESEVLDEFLQSSVPGRLHMR